MNKSILWCHDFSRLWNSCTHECKSLGCQWSSVKIIYTGEVMSPLSWKLALKSTPQFEASGCVLGCFFIHCATHTGVSGLLQRHIQVSLSTIWRDETKQKTAGVQYLVWYTTQKENLNIMHIINEILLYVRNFGNYVPWCTCRCIIH